MDRITDRGTNTLAAGGLEELFFQLCCCVSFLFWREMAGCAVVSVFGSGDYDQKKKVLVVCLAGCAVVSVFGSGGK